MSRNRCVAMMDVLSDIAEWQKNNLAVLRQKRFVHSQITDVTVVSYYFHRDDELDGQFWRTEFAFLKTFETQGLMPAVLVVNKCTPTIERFCTKYSIEIQIAENLVPGKLKTLALDLVCNLHERFKTPYVLTIQEDGFPLRPGLEKFVGKWDYIGAPWVHHATYYDIYPYKYCVGNGGFSLRSKRLCEAASRIYKRWFTRVPYWWYLLGDDTFYCKTLRFWFRNAIKGMLWPTLEEASKFSIECNMDFVPSEPPLGFHAQGFAVYRRFSRPCDVTLNKGEM